MRCDELRRQLAKANRIMRAIEDDYHGASDLEALAAQAEGLGLELVIIRQEDHWDTAATRVPRATVVDYPISDFETRRSQGMADRHFDDDAMAGQQFIDLFLVPFMRYAERLDIFDGSLGENYRDDYAHTLDRFLAAVRQSCHWKDHLRVKIHCCRGKGAHHPPRKQGEKTASGRQTMRLYVDQQADALYLRLDESKIVESEEVSPGVVLDFNAENQVVGVEILHLSKRAPGLEPRKLVFETAPAVATR